MRRAARRDDNEQAIVVALRAAGAFVWPLSERDIPDLLCGFRGKWFLLEVKAPAGPKGGTKGHHAVLRPGQARFFADAEIGELPAFLVRSPEDALRAIGVEVVT